MADFHLPVLFVVPVGNTLPTTGTAAGQLADGVFAVAKDDATTIATNANIATASYIQFWQGRPSLYLGSKRSDKIVASKVKKWYKVTGNATAAQEIWEFSDFTAQCDQDITLTLRGHSAYLDTVSYNGFTRSVTIKTPCCDCGGDPCASVDNEALIDLFLAQIALEDAVQNGPNALTMSTFWSFQKIGTGGSAVLTATGAPITEYSKFCNVALEPQEYDRIWFRGWVYVNPDVTVDFLVYDRCEQAATATLTQRSSFARGTSKEIYQMQIDYYSYQSDYKHLFQMSQFNQKFEDYVTDGTIYDTYYIVYNPKDDDYSWNPTFTQDAMVILAIPQGSTSTIETMLVTYLGTITNESGVAVSTTTSTTTTSTSTSTTTTLIP